MVAKRSQGPTDATPRAPVRTFRVVLDDASNLPLPADIIKELHLEPGTEMELSTSGGLMEARRVSDGHLSEDELEPMPPPLAIEGILKNCFHGWDDIQQFIAEERAGWERNWDTLPEDLSNKS